MREMKSETMDRTFQWSALWPNPATPERLQASGCRRQEEAKRKREKAKSKRVGLFSFSFSF